MANEKRLIDANKISYHKSGFPKGDGFDSRLDWAFREDIDKIPTIDAVEVVHGRWILREDGYHCSRCDIQAIYTGVELKYCPNCGTDMRQRKEDNNG